MTRAVETETSTIVRERLDRLRKWAAQHGLDGILLRKRRSFAWLTMGRCNHIVWTTEEGVADLLIFPDRAICVTTRMESDRIGEEELAGLGFEMIAPEWTEGVLPTLRRLCAGKKIGADVWPDALGIESAVYKGDALFQLTYVLEKEEIRRYAWLCRQAAMAVEETCREVRPGMSEWEIQSRLAAKILPHGIFPQVILVATDERVFRYRHPIPTAKPLRRYAMLVLCAEKWGLVANVTRLVHFGPLPKTLSDRRRKLAEIDLTMNLATRPGVPIRDVLRAGIEAYRRVGHPDDWRYLHQGGPTGYATREFLATPDSEGVVQLHQAFAWNPSLPGIKSEDTIWVDEQANHFLTHTGNWPYIIMERDGQVYQRPDILVIP